MGARGPVSFYHRAEKESMTNLLKTRQRPKNAGGCQRGRFLAHPAGELGTTLPGSPSGRAGGAQRRLRGLPLKGVQGGCRPLAPPQQMASSDAESYIGGLPKGGVSPPLELNYISISPSHASEGTDSTMVWAREGVSERQWRSAANRSTLPRPSALNGRHWRPAPDAAAETRGWAPPSLHPRQARPGGYHKAFPAGERGPSSVRAGNKKEGRSIVYSPAGWYDNAPTLFCRGFAAFKVVELRSTPRKLFEKRLLRPSGALPNSRPSRQARRPKTFNVALPCPRGSAPGGTAPARW